MTIKYVKGNIIEAIDNLKDKNIIVPQNCNDIGKMGSGFAKSIMNFNLLPRQCYLDWYSSKNEMSPDRYMTSGKFNLGQCQIVFCRPRLIIANMIGQHRTIKEGEEKPIRYSALAHAMSWIPHLTKNNMLSHVDGIHTVKFGAGLARGNWDFIEILINEIWIDNGIPVTIYEV